MPRIVEHPTRLGFLRRLLVQCALVLLVAAPGLAQDLAEFDDLTEVSEVLLDVLATDAEGERVLGLGREDFVVEEDGEPVVITGVSYYTTRYDGGEGTAEGETREIPWSRHLVFVFDDQTRFARYGTDLIKQMIKVGAHCQRWVDDEMGPSDWLAVVRWDGKLKVYQDFTQDKDALKQALVRASVGKRPEPVRTPRSGLVSLLRQLPEQGTRRERETIYDALGRLAQASGFIVGRKNLVLFTLGFGEIERGSRVAYHDDAIYAPLETLLNDHNVAVYPIDVSPPGRSNDYSEALEQLAEDTGGEYHENFIGFVNPLRDVAEENTGYYLVSYQSARPAGEIGYQRLEVKAVDPAIEVRARRGYRYGL